jgi:DNA invertase Pin-like site-specific DNA recombinase
VITGYGGDRAVHSIIAKLQPALNLDRCLPSQKLSFSGHERRAQTNDFATSPLPAGFLGFLRCKKVLHYWFDWRYICAMLIGYARVSTDDQDTAAQAAALKAAGCERVFREKASGGRWDRPELHRLLDQLRKEDVLVVWKLDRLSRSLRDVLTIMERLGEAKAGFRSLTEAIDTTTPAGRMMMQMVGAFAEFEKAMLKERTKAGLDAAREEGRIGGRRPKLSPQQQAEIRKMVSKGDRTAADAARLFKIHPATVSRLLARAPRSKTAYAK